MAAIFGNMAAFNVRLGTEITAQHRTLFSGHGSANRTFNFQRRVSPGHSSFLPPFGE
jgi:hypothetical protein